MFDLKYQGHRDALLQSPIGQMHLTAVNYVNQNTQNPNTVVRYGDLQFRDVMNNIIFLNPRNFGILLKYYNGIVTPQMYFNFRHFLSFYFHLYFKILSKSIKFHLKLQSQFKSNSN